MSGCFTSSSALMLRLVILAALSALASSKQPEEDEGQCALQVGGRNSRGPAEAAQTSESETRTSEDPIKMLAVGDFGAHSGTQTLVAEGMDRVASSFKPWFVAGLGDNVYENGAHSQGEIVQKWQERFVTGRPNLRVPWYMVVGNHDWRSGPLKQLEFTNSSQSEGYWTYPNLWYKKSYRTCRESADFFFIDTMIWAKRAHTHRYFSLWADTVFQDQRAWLESELGKSTADWKVVIGHHPLYTTGLHESEAIISELRSLDRLLREHGVAVYINGHNHNQELIYHKRMVYITSGNGARRYAHHHGGCIRNYGGSHIPHKGSRGISRLFDCNGGFVAFKVQSRYEAQVIFYDRFGDRMPHGTFKIKHPPSRLPLPSSARALPMRRARCHGVRLDRVDAICSPCTVLPSVTNDMTCDEYCSSHGLTCVRALRTIDDFGRGCEPVRTARCSEQAENNEHAEENLACQCGKQGF